MKRFLKSNYKYIFSFILLFVISYFFPYTADDFYWGSKSLSIKEFINISKDIYLNGRYLGDFFAIIMVKSRILRSLIVSLVINLIFYLISKRENVKFWLVGLLFLAIFPLILAQSVVWASGFANYGLSALLVIYLYYEKDNLINSTSKKYHVIHGLLVFLGQFFLENISIFVVCYFIYLNIISYRKNRKINVALIVYLIISFIGLILMFSHPSYISSFGIYGNGYKKISYKFVDIKERIFSNYSRTCKYTFIFSFVFTFILSLMLFVKDKRKRFSNKKINLMLHSYNLVFCLYSLIRSLFLNQELDLLNSILSTIFILNIIYFMFCFYKKEKDLWEILLMMIMIILPLSIVQPIGARNFFIINLLEIIFIIKLNNKEKIFTEDKGFLCKYLKFILGLLICFLSFIYIYLGILDWKRNDYIKKEVDKGNTNIMVFKYPFPNYIWRSDVNVEYFGSYYNKFYGYNDEVKYYNIPLNEWRKLTK